MESLFDKLTHYGSSEVLPMHMPGHKRKTGFMRGVSRYDITEITGFDNLHNPQGILKEAMEEAADLYGSDSSRFLVNGSTAGVFSAILTAVKPKGKLLMAANCHKSAFNAVMLGNINVTLLQPKVVSPLNVWGSITPEDVKAALKKEPDVDAVLITSPTYDGIVSDIENIAAVCHKKKIPLIVDSAHGAHFPFGEGCGFPKDALSCGADYVIESLHKTLPSLTQTAIIHTKGDLADRERLDFMLQCFQTTSPSYLLISSCIECLCIMEREGRERMREYAQRLSEVRYALNHICQGYLLDKQDGIFDYDKGKLVMGFKGYAGTYLRAKLLKDYGIETETGNNRFFVAMTSLMDSDEDMFRFTHGMQMLRRDLPLTEETKFPMPEQKLPKGKITTEMIMNAPCPPGIICED